MRPACVENSPGRSVSFSKVGSRIPTYPDPIPTHLDHIPTLFQPYSNPMPTHPDPFLGSWHPKVGKSIPTLENETLPRGQGADGRCVPTAAAQISTWSESSREGPSGISQGHGC
jgi:hypothetical protein